MPRLPKDDRPASEQVAWVAHLPNEGGDWGRGIISMVTSVESDVGQLEGELERQRQEHQAEKDRLESAWVIRRDDATATIKLRKRLLADTVKRARAECGMLFADVQMSVAMKQAQETVDATEEAAEPYEGEHGAET